MHQCINIDQSDTRQALLWFWKYKKSKYHSTFKGCLRVGSSFPGHFFSITGHYRAKKGLFSPRVRTQLTSQKQLASVLLRFCGDAAESNLDFLSPPSRTRSPSPSMSRRERSPFQLVTCRVQDNKVTSRQHSRGSEWMTSSRIPRGWMGFCGENLIERKPPLL